MTVYVGIDWAEEHHDVCVLDQDGARLVARRIADGVEGVATLHALIAQHADEPSQVTVGIELDRGLLATALLAAGYDVVKIEPLATARYRDRFASSGAKSDTSDARVLGDAVRTDGHLHRRLDGDTELVESVRVLARAHQMLVWERTRQVQRLRESLREYFPAALAAFPDLTHIDALAVLEAAPDPTQAARLSSSKIQAALRRGGRKLRVVERAAEIQTALRAHHLTAPPRIAAAHAAVVTSLVSIIRSLDIQLDALAQELAEGFKEHPDAAILLSFPGLGDVLGARVLAEIGDDRSRFNNARSMRDYAGTSPITRASGQRRGVFARHIRNRRIGDAIDRWAFASLRGSPGARAFYDKQRANGKTHGQAVRALGNKLIGQLYGCLTTASTLYNEDLAWRDQPKALAA